MPVREFQVRYPELQAPDVQTARETATERLDRSLRVGIEYHITDHKTIIHGENNYEVILTFVLDTVPEKTQTNLALNQFFPGAELTTPV